MKMAIDSTARSFGKRLSVAGSAAVMVIAMFAACAEQPTDPPIIVTRWTALLEGTLIEEAGCLRVTGPDQPDGPSRALVWQKDIFEVTRSGDEVTIVDLIGNNGQPDEPMIWRIGNDIRAGGGELRLGGVIDHAGEEFAEKCVGPYWLFSGS